MPCDFQQQMWQWWHKQKRARQMMKNAPRSLLEWLVSPRSKKWPCHYSQQNETSFPIRNEQDDSKSLQKKATKFLMKGLDLWFCSSGWGGRLFHVWDRILFQPLPTVFKNKDIKTQIWHHSLAHFPFCSVLLFILTTQIWHCWRNGVYERWGKPKKPADVKRSSFLGCGFYLFAIIARNTGQKM